MGQISSEDINNVIARVGGEDAITLRLHIDALERNLINAQRHAQACEKAAEAAEEELAAWMHENHPEPEPIFDEDGEWVNYDEFMHDAPFSVFVARMIHDGASYDAGSGVWWRSNSAPGIVVDLERQLALADKLRYELRVGMLCDEYDGDAIVEACAAYDVARKLSTNGARAYVWPQSKR